MDRQPHGRGSRRGRRPEPGFTLSHDSAREVVDRTGPPRPRESFLSTDHLSTEAAAAFVDGRLPQSGLARAEAHLARCPDCRREVDDQHEARRVLRGSGPIRMPRELLERLRSLEDAAEPADRAHGWAAGGPDAATGGGSVDGTGVGPGRRADWARLLRRVWRRGN